jgi:hypothetical protein
MESKEHAAKDKEQGTPPILPGARREMWDTRNEIRDFSAYPE